MNNHNCINSLGSCFATTKMEKSCGMPDGNNELIGTIKVVVSEILYAKSLFLQRLCVAVTKGFSCSLVASIKFPTYFAEIKLQ